MDQVASLLVCLDVAMHRRVDQVSRQDPEHFLFAVVGPDFLEAVIFEFLAATFSWAADVTEFSGS